MPTDQEITARVTARGEADELLSLAVGVVASLDPESAKAFWLQIAKTSAVAAGMGQPRKLSPAEIDPRRDTVTPMTDQQACAFGRVVIPFGKHAGKLVDETPLDYLIWLSEQRDPFKEQLRRYVKSRRVQDEQEEPNDE